MPGKKTKTQFECQNCGYAAPRWLGKCPECDSWNSFMEEKITVKVNSAVHNAPKKTPVSVREILPETQKRIQTGINEFDRVLGGGLVAGGVFLIGGSPGMGKSTLLLQASNLLALQGLKILYISGEESVSQIKIRAERLNVNADSLYLLSETNLDLICGFFENDPPDIVIVDSIQTVYSPQFESLPGNISQVRYAGYKLIMAAKEACIPLLLIGHLTKDGNLAGPRVLEHMVDGLLLLEGDQQHLYRLLRAVKNRFGSTNEVGVFEMTDSGIQEVDNPSLLLISQRNESSSGTVITVSMEGSRPLLLEIQALATSSSYGVPQRTATGIPQKRLNLLLAVLEKRLGLRFGTQDVFINTAGGFNLSEPASDLAALLALVSSLKNQNLNSRLAVIGEVGLTGEVRGITHVQQRINECVRLGFTNIMLPAIHLPIKKSAENVKIISVKTVNEAVEKAFSL